jgi:hypothetical protein
MAAARENTLLLLLTPFIRIGFYKACFSGPDPELETMGYERNNFGKDPNRLHGRN